MNVFISHDSRDKYLMDALRKIIIKTKVLKPIVIVREQEVMEDFTKKVQSGIDKSYYMFPILSEASYQNQWVNQEIGYATCKLIKIIPIVENSVLTKLKGFIHSYRDLPYQFSNAFNSNEQFRKHYREICERAVKKVVESHFYDVKTIELFSDLFQGQWDTKFDKQITITGNEYYVDNKLEFYIDQIECVLEKNIISFRKLKQNNTNLIYKIELEIKSKYEYYKGTERCSSDGGTTYSEPYQIVFQNKNFKPQVSYTFGSDNTIIAGRNVSKNRL